MTEKLYIGQDTLERALQGFCRDMFVGGHTYDYIAGVARGGLIPATMLSHYMSIPLITVPYSLRDAQMTCEFAQSAVEEVASMLRDGRRVLLVDDICDEGHTLADLNRALAELAGDSVKNLNTYVVVYNEACKTFQPTFASLDINKETNPSWVVFPWENWWERA